MTKTRSEILGGKMELLFLKKSFENVGHEIFFHPPKVGAKSPAIARASRLGSHHGHPEEARGHSPHPDFFLHFTKS